MLPLAKSAETQSQDLQVKVGRRSSSYEENPHPPGSQADFRYPMVDNARLWKRRSRSSLPGKFHVLIVAVTQQQLLADVLISSLRARKLRDLRSLGLTIRVLSLRPRYRNRCLVLRGREELGARSVRVLHRRRLRLGSFGCHWLRGRGAHVGGGGDDRVRCEVLSAGRASRLIRRLSLGFFVEGRR